MRAVRAHLAWLAAVALVASGCQLLVEPPIEQLVNVCDDDDDCAPGGTCDGEHRLCVARAAPDYALRVEVTPSSDPLGGTPLPMLFDLGRADEVGTPELIVPVPALVEGRARLDGAPIAAEVTFTPRLSPGTRTRAFVSGSVSVRASATTNGRVDFVTQLSAGSYDVYVEPLSDWRRRLPPLYAVLEVPEGSGVSFDLPYRSEDLVEVRGVVRDPSGASRAGLLVRAVDPVSGRTLSSVTSTDERGAFSLVMSRTVTSFAFRVRGDTTRPGDPSALFPRLTIDPSTLLPQPDGSFVLLVPSADRALRLEGTVELPPSLGQNRPAVGAQVRLRASQVSDPETGLTGSLELDLTTNESGRFAGFVLPGLYQVEIVGAEEGAGILVDDFEVVPNPSNMILGQVFTLPTRAILGGTVQLADGEPVYGARLRASALGLPLDGASVVRAATLNRSATSSSGSMGEFRMPLDVGRYDLAVEMPRETRYAWTVQRDFGVGSTGAPLRRVLTVRAPHRIEASARFADGSPLRDAQVRFFAVDDTTGRLVQVGASTTDEDGRLVAYLPAALE